jgi:UDP-N-acetylglucosamine diphosphorylase/glucosamine-1-phosphate N-acetyltransferase
MIFIYEDSAERFEPLSMLRPVSEILCGAKTFREKLEKLTGEEAHLIVREELLDLCAEQWPELSGGINQVPEGRHIFIAAGTVLTEPLRQIETDELLVDERGAVLGFGTDALVGYLDAEGVGSFLKQAGFAKHKVAGHRISYPWDIFASLELEVTRDFEGALSEGKVDPAATVYGSALRIEKGACVEAGVVIDCRKGPVTVARNALIKGPTLIEGPSYIGPDSIVDSARLRAGTVLGPVCRVGGEVEASIFHGYVNKHHEGFIGHAYLGEWVNLGAMSTNSDLKNNYSEVKVNLRGEIISTGLMKFGGVIGDHTKTAIGTLIPTGSIAGIFANVLGGGLCSRNIPSFSWGEANVYQLDKLLETAEIVMQRRGIQMGEALKERITALYEKHVG